MGPDLQSALQAMGPEESVAVIITFAGGADSSALGIANKTRRRVAVIRSLRSVAERSQRDMRAFLRSRGVAKMRPLWLINGLAVTAKRDVVRQMADMPGVVGVRRDRRYYKDDLLMQVTAPPEDNIAQVGAPALWALGYFGQGVTIGLMDSGADVGHPDLAATWRGGTNSWLDPYGQYLTPADSDGLGHGTAVLGIMVAGDAGGTTIGMAPDARWIAARMFDDQGISTDSVIHQIFQWFLDPDGNPATDDAPDVINGSWGLDDNNGQAGTCIPEFQPDITALNAAGIATVFAAGNSGPGAATSISPADNAGAIAVGAVDSTDVVFDLSSRGPSACDGRIYPDMMAPGVAILTTDRSFGGFLNYTVGSGTSFSAPHASGALALLLCAFPQATLDNLKTALLASAVDLGITGPDFDYGNGRINVDAAAGAYAYLRDTLGLVACVRPDIFLSASPIPGVIGQPITFTGTVSGGSGSYTYEWDVNGDSLTDYTTSTPVNYIQHTYTTAYTGSVGLRVAAVSTPWCTAELVITDQWACPTITALISAQPNPGLVGEPVVFRSTVSGGTLPYTYAWDLDSDGSVDCTTDTCTKTYAAAFDGTVSLVVFDSDGCSAADSRISFNIQPAPSQNVDSGGGSGGCFIGTALEAGRLTGVWP
jgi:subtilisin family serine protease